MKWKEGGINMEKGRERERVQRVNEGKRSRGGGEISVMYQKEKTSALKIWKEYLSFHYEHD